MLSNIWPGAISIPWHTCSYSHFFYKKILIFRNVLRQNLIKIYTETHQIALLFSKFLEGAYFKIKTKMYRL